MTTLRTLPGFRFIPGYLDRPAQQALLAELEAVLASAPPYTPRMPKTGKPMSVRITNCGPLGWVTDERGYRYQPTHPETGEPWPAMPPLVVAAWTALAGYPHPQESCLVNCYGPAAKLGLHQDRDEATSRRRWSRSRSAIPACFGSAERSATTRPGPSVLHPATPWCWAATRGWPFTASTGSSRGPRRCCRKAAGSISRSGG